MRARLTLHKFPKLTVTGRVESADASLCVLSAPDVINETGEIQHPPTVAPLIKENTFVLVNKMDLLSPPHLSSPPLPSSWFVSLQTGDGTQHFINGLGTALQQRSGSMQDGIRSF